MGRHFLSAFLFLVALIAGAWGQCEKSLTIRSGVNVCQGSLLLHDKFPYLDTQSWKNEIFMPDEPDYEFVLFDDKKENFKVQNGLHIRPTVYDDEFVRKGKLRLARCTGNTIVECEKQGRTFTFMPPIRSARITTKDSLSFKYGKVRITAKLPAGDWLIPEMWLEPKDRLYGRAYQSGRIRIAHSFGNRVLDYKGQDVGSRMLRSGIVMGTDDRTRVREIRKQHPRSKGWYEDLHNYTVIWKPDSISFQVDDEAAEEIVNVNSQKLYSVMGFDKKTAGQWDQGTTFAPFDQEFYVSIGLSAGGVAEFPDDSVTSDDHTKPWNNRATKALLDFWNDRDSWMRTWNNDKELEFYVSEIMVEAL